MDFNMKKNVVKSSVLEMNSIKMRMLYGILWDRSFKTLVCLEL